MRASGFLCIVLVALSGCSLTRHPKPEPTPPPELQAALQDFDGVFAGKTPDMLRTVGAPDHAQLMQQANELLAPGGLVPRDRSMRQALLKGVDATELAAIEDAWYKLEPLEDIVARFIRAHPQDFFA